MRCIISRSSHLHVMAVLSMRHAPSIHSAPRHSIPAACYRFIGTLRSRPRARALTRACLSSTVRLCSFRLMLVRQRWTSSSHPNQPLWRTSSGVAQDSTLLITERIRCRSESISTFSLSIFCAMVSLRGLGSRWSLRVRPVVRQCGHATHSSKELFDDSARNHFQNDACTSFDQHSSCMMWLHVPHITIRCPSPC